MTRQRDLTCRDALAALAASADHLATCGPLETQSAIRQVLDDCEVAGYVLRYPVLGSQPPLGERLQAYHAHGQCTLKEYGVIQHFVNWVHEHDQAYRSWAGRQPPESDALADISDAAVGIRSTVAAPMPSSEIERRVNKLALVILGCVARLRSQGGPPPDFHETEEGLDLEADWEKLVAILANARRLVDAQAKDEGLWFADATASEAYLQQALRRLHAAVEATL